MDTSRPEGMETRSFLPYCYYYYDYDYCRVGWPPCAHEPSVVKYASTSGEVIGLFFLLSTAPTAKLVSRSRDDLLHPFCVRILSSLSSLFLAKHYAEQVRTKGS